MKKFILPVLGILIILIFNSSCTNEKPISTVNVSKPQLDQVNSNNNPKTPEKPKEVIQINEYQLREISGQCSPDGGHYEFDKIKKQWCSRPSAGDVMSYAKMSGIDDYSKIPDISSYFDRKISNKLNSCKLLVKTEGNARTVTIYFQGNVIYKNTFDIDNSSNTTNWIKLPNLYKLNLNDINGNMAFDNARNYKLDLTSSKPIIKFENEFGNYELRFEGIDL
jgi:hypothetical protein